MHIIHSRTFFFIFASVIIIGVVSSLLTAIILGYLIEKKVVKSIEKKYNKDVDMLITISNIVELPFARYNTFALTIILMYLDKKEILKNKMYKSKINPLIKINYNVLEEDIKNIKICFISVYNSLFMMFNCILVAIFISIYG